MTTITPAEFATKVGEKIGTSEWILVDQDMINKFADATGDHQFIHINEEMAKMTPFGGTIAHGFLTLSLFPVLSAKSDCPKIEGVKMGVNYGGNKTRFLAPVRSGKRVRGHFKLLELLKSALANGSRRLSSLSRLRVKTNQHFRLNGSASFSYNF